MSLPPSERGANGRFQKKEAPQPPMPGEETVNPMSKLLYGWVESPRAGFILLAVVVGLLAFFTLLDFVAVDHGKSSKPWWLYLGFGFFGFSLAVLSGWPLGSLLRRDEDYYGEADTTPADIEAKE